MLLAAIYRGVIIQAWAHVEFVTADLVMRAKRLPEYGETVVFRHAFPKRIAEVKALLAIPGPLDPFKARILSDLDGMEPFETYRHFMAHGLLTIRDADDFDESEVNIRLYDTKKGGGLEFGHMPTTLKQLETLAMDITSASNKIVDPIATAIVDLKLEPA